MEYEEIERLIALVKAEIERLKSLECKNKKID